MVNTVYKLDNNDFVVAPLKPKESYRSAWINFGKEVDRRMIYGEF